jgi:hypothetical protein
MLVEPALRALVTYQLIRFRITDRLVKDESGEGVISAAIAVLVMAFLGAAMWLAFKAVFDTADTKVQSNVNDIGS